MGVQINLWKTYTLFSTECFFDYLFAYPLTTLGEKLRVYKMGTMSRFQLFVISIFTAGINYLYQMFVEEALKSKKQNTH